MKLTENRFAPTYGQGSKELQEFLESTVAGGLVLRPPHDGAAFWEDYTLISLFRDPPFQVELIIAKPDRRIGSHAHPDIESFEIGVSGDLAFFLDDNQVSFFRPPRPDGVSRGFGKYAYIPAGAFHSGWSGPKGASFLSVQRWLNGVTPTSVLLNWTGEPASPTHRERLSQ